MLTLIVSGGIAMGKSTVVDGLRASELIAPVVFDADACVSELLTAGEICRMIAEEFGRSALREDGSVDRPFLREQVFDNAQRRAALENILHPEVRKRFERARERASAERVGVFLADIPLYFESQFPYPADIVLVVAASPAIQMARLLRREGISREVAERMVAAQLPIDTKMDRGDVVIWNSGSLQQLHTQLNQFITWLRTKI